MSDGRFLHHQPQKNLTLVGGSFVFAVVHMNTHGGAILQSLQPLVGVANTLLSMEWMDPVVEQGYLDFNANHPSPRHDIPSGLGNRRVETLAQLTHQVSSRRGTCLAAIGQQLYGALVNEYMYQPEQLRHLLLHLPFVLYHDLLEPCLQKLTPDDVAVVHAWLNMVFEGFNDSVWTNQCQDLVLLQASRTANSSDRDDVLRLQMFTVMYKLLTAMGQWFAKKTTEYRAALWCHEKALALSAAHGMDNCVSYALDYLAQTNYRCDDMLSAFLCLEQSMAMGPTESRVRHARAIRAAAKTWIGTSGTLTPFARVEKKNGKPLELVCASCGQANVRNRAGCCRLIYYCNKQCQKAHWVRVHRHTCLFAKTK